ncbi:MAG TPA: 3-phosphoshikimate 1-carboxyvinyltransferase [Polyangia bacterium]|jgi:3-phosphoshikimate 1-carboxyvinyltransferase
MRLRVRPQPGRALAGAATVPGDKSVSHRALIFGALGTGDSVVTGFSGGDDNRRTAAALRALGVGVEERGTTVIVHGAGLGGLTRAVGPLDCGNSGTTIRLLCGLLCGQPFPTALDGDASLRARPMRRVAEPLARMGARIDGAPGARPGDIVPPLRVHGLARGARLVGTTHDLAVASAQVKSAILLAALGARGVTRVTEPELSRDHTERLMAALGLPLSVIPGARPAVALDGDAVRPFPGRPFAVPGDLSSAAFLLAAGALVPGSRVTVRGVSVNPTRTGVLDALTAMGLVIGRGAERDEGGEPTADLTVAADDLAATHIAGALTVRSIDELPILAALATRAAGTTEIRDAGELRVKESDRIATMAAELRRLGAELEELPDGLRVHGPAPLRGARCTAHGDHRVAMSLCVLALVAEGETVVEEADSIVTSFPGFTAALGALGADVTQE